MGQVFGAVLINGFVDGATLRDGLPDFGNFHTMASFPIRNLMSA